MQSKSKKKTKESEIPPHLLYRKPEYQNYSLHQLQHNREKIVKAYLEIREKLVEQEQLIAFLTCPWYLGQIVSYNPLDGNPPSHVIIIGISYTIKEPFYSIKVKDYYPARKAVAGKPRIIENITHIIGVTNHSEDNILEYQERIINLYESGNLALDKNISFEKILPQIVHSRERGNRIARLSPLVEQWLKIQNR